jgi:hypothetical protein
MFHNRACRSRRNPAAEKALLCSRANQVCSKHSQTTVIALRGGESFNPSIVSASSGFLTMTVTSCQDAFGSIQPMGASTSR